MADTDNNMPSQQQINATLAAAVSAALAPVIQQQVATTTALLEKMGELNMRMQRVDDRVMAQFRLVDEHERMLRGGDRSGLLARIERIEALSERHEDSLQEIVDALRGSEDKPGIVGRVSHLESKADSLARPMWMILSALVGTGITLVISNLFR